MANNNTNGLQPTARTINEIQTEILYNKDSASELDALSILIAPEQANVNSDSKVSEWRLWVWVTAVAIWTLEKLFNIFKIEVEERIAATRVHTRRWYREKALVYQYDDTLNESDVYDVIDPAKQIVKYASVRKIILSGHGALRVKVCKDNNGALEVLTTAELDGFTNYMNQITDAGTMVMPTSSAADQLKLELDIYYNPQLIDNTGADLDTGENVALTAIKSYLKQMDFDGRLILTKLIDALQAAKGVELPVLKYAAARTDTGNYEDLYNMNTGVREEFYNPDAGWLQLDEANTVINYIPYDE